MKIDFKNSNHYSSKQPKANSIYSLNTSYWRTKHTWNDEFQYIKNNYVRPDNNIFLKNQYIIMKRDVNHSYYGDKIFSYSFGRSDIDSYCRSNNIKSENVSWYSNLHLKGYNSHKGSYGFLSPNSLINYNSAVDYVDYDVSMTAEINQIGRKHDVNHPSEIRLSIYHTDRNVD